MCSVSTEDCSQPQIDSIVFGVFTISKSDRSFRSDRNKMQFLRLLKVGLYENADPWQNVYTSSNN